MEYLYGELPCCTVTVIHGNLNGTKDEKLEMQVFILTTDFANQFLFKVFRENALPASAADTLAAK